MIEYDRIKAVINLKNIRDNIISLKKCIPDGTKVMLVVKADGYGHGAGEIAKYAGSLAYAYGVAIIDEAVALREEGIDKMILVLSYTPKEYLGMAVEYGISQAVTDFETAKYMSDAAVRLGKKAKIHIKLDTGMGRLGFSCDSAGIREIERISKLPNIELEGCFTHFSKADEKDMSYTEAQFEKYMDMADRLRKTGITFKLLHACNSAAAMRYPKAALDMVRLGIAIYGLYPSREVEGESKDVKLKPAMEIVSRVSYVKKVPAGSLISYGGTYETKRDSVIATIPAGYADGYPRALSNIGKVLINGRCAPIAGRICMDQFMADVTDIPGVKKGDGVVLLGKSGNESISAEELSEPANSFNYEFVCGVGKRVPREYIR